MIKFLKVVKPDGTTISYTHDPMGRRVAKSINGEIVEKYLWLDRTTLLAIYDKNDNLVQRFNYADSIVPYSMQINNETYYLAYDQVGSLRVVSDGSGNIVKELSYDSFGNILTDTNENFKVLFGFAGGIHDKDTNLVRFGFRDYDPNIGKWTAKDPILFAGGDSNLYGYVLNDPINLVDPSGFFGMGDVLTSAPFLSHYFFGFGQNMDISPNSHLGGLLINSLRPQMNDMIDKAKNGAKNSCDSSYNGKDSRDYALANKKLLFAMGDGTLFGNSSCSNGTCNMHFFIRDAFIDALDIYDMIPYVPLDMLSSHPYAIHFDYNVKFNY